MNVSNLRIIVAIASYGSRNDQYLRKLIDEYRSMPFEIDMVILSNLRKEVPDGIELVVGLPDKDPWSLPFGHKKLFAERLNEYDLFIYSEDDTLITENNIRAFLRVGATLERDEIPGFLRFENGPNGKKNYCDVHGNFHWDPISIRRREKHTLAFFTNEHAACYILTREHLKRAIESGGFLVGPHQWKYDLLCSAATDPYTQCGMKKLICISELNDFIVHHLPDKYIGKFGLAGPEFERQVKTLLHFSRTGHAFPSLFQTETKLKRACYSKDYYEPESPEILSSIPATCRNILSIGCGSGILEAELAARGMRIVAVPLDSVISSSIENEGIEIVTGDLLSVRDTLANRRFDCLIFSNILHLVKDPANILASFAGLMPSNSLVIATAPNLSLYPFLGGKFRANAPMENFKNYETTGVNYTSPQILRKWFKRGEIKIEKLIGILPRRLRSASSLALGLLDPILSAELVAVGRKI
jgi:2-polyprenyl-3-methyl-5-hydroxy-6-metoxy-1,4-benzoquinol methylase